MRQAARALRWAWPQRLAPPERPDVLRSGASFSTRIVPAEVARQVAQRWQGLARLPRDVVAELTAFFADHGLRKRHAQRRVLALSRHLQQLSRSPARGGLRPYRQLPGGAEAAAAARLAPGGAGSGTAAAGGPLQQLLPARGRDGDALAPVQALGPAAAAAELAVAEWAADAVSYAHRRSGRLSGKALAAIEVAASLRGPLSLGERELRAWAGLPPPLADAEEEEAARAAAPSYSLPEAQAYALARMGGSNAALAHIFGELAGRLPGFTPRAMLDYGAGPGTAIWAADEVWPEAVALAHAVEPSHHMVRLGRRLEEARREGRERPPFVSWHPDLASLAGVPGARRGGAAYGSRRRLVASRGRAGRHAALAAAAAGPDSARRELGFARGMLAARLRRYRRRYDLVVASYVLSEVAGPRERAAIVARLWSLTGDTLVLVEPGTPSGFANVADARAALLTSEARKAAKVARRAAAAAAALGGGAALDQNLAAKLRRYGAHVAAPCPHDGPCPLAGGRAWCHFGQRFHRPSWMQEVKARPGHRTSHRDHQDERFSYVVIRRGARPSGVPDVGITATFETEGRASEAAGEEGAGQSPLRRQLPQFGPGGPLPVIPEAAVRRRVEANRRAAWAALAAAGQGQQQQGQQQQGQQLEPVPGQWRLDEGVDGATFAAQSAAASSDDEAGAASQSEAVGPSDDLDGADEPGLALERLEALGAASSSGGAPQGLVSAGGGAAAEVAAVAAADEEAARERLSRVNARLGPFGFGLVDRLTALEDQGIDWTSGAPDGGTGGLEAAAEPSPTAPPAAAADDSGDVAPQAAVAGDEAWRAQRHPSLSPAQERELALAQLAARLGGPAAAAALLQASGTPPQPAAAAAEAASAAAPEAPADIDWRRRDPESYGLAAAASYGWSRVIRPPRKRGGHVVLDLCAPAPHAASSSGGDGGDGGDGGAGAVGRGSLGLLRGRLERHVVTRGDAAKWMGGAAYRLARQARWGDLWPSFYNANPKRQVVAPPEAPGLYEEEEEGEGEEEEWGGGGGSSGGGGGGGGGGSSRGGDGGSGGGRRRGLGRRWRLVEARGAGGFSL
ncbi:hypothetical protein Rsub_08516 [Raphidocelis subcapitata]|uniref:Uncharacterized protein n=1 Tax=Raphidocelis subcapitata TaxID=307507 RepID=A0A2V0PEL5_9CHLO|nr:hypothetical protein Rsub_08516 [Raphidocelis subcapitata]|eukprot:GBF95535.1 hypothetical protein Rsub_08516 [Raphidocelis subcapitata]